MPRYDHFIDVKAPGRNPSMIICVDCESHEIPDINSRNNAVEQLERWHAVVMSLAEGRYQITRTAQGIEADDFWQHIARLTRRHGGLWIVSYRCTRVWGLLELWERLEDGRLQLHGRDDRAAMPGNREGDNRATQAGVTRAETNQGDGVRGGAGSGGYLVIEDPPCIASLRCRDSAGQFTWLDTRNYGAEVPSRTRSGYLVARYIADSVQRMAEYCDTYKLGGLKQTSGSQAMSAWRTSYLSHSIWCHNESAAVAGESSAYIGARCECYRLGQSSIPLWHLDFRSMYPAICQTNLLPIRLRCYSVNHSVARGIMEAYRSQCICRVAIDTDEPAYPFRHDNEVYYPTGKFQTWLCGPELTDALEHNRVKWVYECMSYEMDYALRDYATELYKARQAAEHLQNKDIARWIKQLLVCLPGKLGQRDRKWVPVPDSDSDIMYGTWWAGDRNGKPARYRAIAGNVERDECLGFCADAVPAMAAFVTSAGRKLLLEVIRLAGWEHVFYCDTDAVIVDEMGQLRLWHSNMIRENELGYLTIKAAHSTIEVIGIKHYIEDGKRTCAGLPRGHVHDLGDGKTYLHHSAPMQQVTDEHRPAPVIVPRSYASQSQYHHGVVLPDGRVRPWHVVEGKLT